MGRRRWKRAIGNRQWAIGNRQWAIGNGKKAMGSGRVAGRGELGFGGAGVGGRGGGGGEFEDEFGGAAGDVDRLAAAVLVGGGGVFGERGELAEFGDGFEHGFRGEEAVAVVGDLLDVGEELFDLG
jgi:hypothetical protein